MREVAGGAMGVVFEARHRRLDLRVALKVLRPEMATAVAAERFVAEGRILARLSHPGIVRVYDAAEKDGFLYYAMEFVEGESLADRLERGALPPAEAIRLGHDLLGALETAHALGVVHRDIKPANIFLRQGRALLGDFGVARWQQAPDAANTTPGELIGTLRYMSPEQRDGVPASKRTDVYAAGLVLWEACTGERWDYQSPDAAEWRRIPPDLVAPLRRALALDPRQRWPDAGAMRRALDGSARRPRWPLAVGGTAVAALVVLWLWPPPPPNAPHGAVSIAVAAFRPDSGSTRRLADSVSAALRVALEYPDFYVLPAGAPPDSALVQVTGFIDQRGGRVRLRAHWTSGIASDTVGREGALADWGEVVQQLSLGLARSLWTRDSVADDWLPVDALPANQRSFDLWLRAEQFLAQARWEEAYDAYASAEAADSACLLCSFRLLDIDRWLDKTHSAERLVRLEAGIGRFTPPYQRLIHAALAELPERLDTLVGAAAEARNFFLASFQYGDELFHRGPLHGRPRSDALGPLRRAVQLRPRFAPGWEHLTWILLSEGDSLEAAAALDSLLGFPAASSGFSAALRVFLWLGYHWRFLPADSARRFSRGVLSNPGIAGREEATAGARLLMTADAPRGAVEFGGMLAKAWPDRSDAVTGGLLGQLFGYAATGRLDSLRATGDRLSRHSPDSGYPLLAYELEALLRAFDPEPAVRRSPDQLRRKLDRYLVPAAFPRKLRERAAWASGLLAIRSGDSLGARTAREIFGPGDEGLRALLAAADLAERGDPSGALEALPAMPALDAPGESPDPLLDAAVRLLRAELLGRRRDYAGERSSLLWFQHLQTIGPGTGPPQPGEVGWAAGTLARWRLALMSVSTGTAKERCAAWAAVARNWSTGDPPFRARADSAGRAASGPDCT